MKQLFRGQHGQSAIVRVHVLEFIGVEFIFKRLEVAVGTASVVANATKIKGFLSCKFQVLSKRMQKAGFLEFYSSAVVKL